METGDGKNRFDEVVPRFKNAFFRDGEGVPTQLFAWRGGATVDAEGDNATEETLTIDGFGAEWFSSIGQVSMRDYLSAPLVRLSIEVESLPKSIRSQNAGADSWWRIVIGSGKTRATLFPSLDGPAVDKNVHVEVVKDDVLRGRLNETTYIGLPVRSSRQIAYYMRSKDAPAGIAVYDVGQGNCNAIIDDQLRPIIYFDFGGGHNVHASTYPIGVVRFCKALRPWIVLSHWHSDHWYSAKRDSRFLRQRWLVPEQRLSAPNIAFIAEIIHAGGKIHVWRGGTPIKSGWLELGKAAGTSTNDSGLYAIATIGGKRVLLPGDASYTTIAACASRKYDVLVASHHGGINPGSVPRPRSENSILVYSYGEPNRYGHPVCETKKAHGAAGWNVVRETHLSRGGGPGHVVVYVHRMGLQKVACTNPEACSLTPAECILI